MADLSKAEVRLTQQDRITNRRDGILPNRRNTEAPKLEVNADMRTARRGDVGGAEELMKIFGGTEKALGAFQDYAENKFRAQEQANSSQGLADAAAGRQDEQLMRKSQAYRDAISTGESDKLWYEGEAQLREKIDTALNDPDDPADTDDIQAIIDDHFKTLAIGPDGKLKDFGSPVAQKRIAERMIEARSRYLANAQEIITKQVQERAINTTTFNMTEGLKRGEELNFESRFATIPPGTDLKAAKSSFINTATNYAQGLVASYEAHLEDPSTSPAVDPKRALSIMDQLLASKRADGTPSLNPEERDAIQTERRRMANDIQGLEKQAEAKRHDENSAKFMDRLMRVPGSGTYPSMSEVLNARKAGLLSPQDAHQLTNWIESDQREAEAEARQAAADRRRSSRDDDDDDDMGVPGGAAGADLMSRVYDGKITAPQARLEVLRRANAGFYGTGKARKKAVSALGEEINKFASLRQNSQSADPGYRSAKSQVSNVGRVWNRMIDQAPLPPSKKKEAKAWIAKRTTLMNGLTSRVHRDGGKYEEFVDKSIGMSDREFRARFNVKPRR